MPSDGFQVPIYISPFKYFIAPLLLIRVHPQVPQGGAFHNVHRISFLVLGITIYYFLLQKLIESQEKLPGEEIIKKIHNESFVQLCTRFFFF